MGRVISARWSHRMVALGLVLSGTVGVLINDGGRTNYTPDGSCPTIVASRNVLAERYAIGAYGVLLLCAGATQLALEAKPMTLSATPERSQLLGTVVPRTRILNARHRGIHCIFDGHVIWPAVDQPYPPD